MTFRLFKNLVITSLLVAMSELSAFAQSQQLKPVFHSTIDISEHVFVSGWMITNIRTDTSNNINLFGGLGYKQKNWWTEAMIQRQWNSTGNQWLLDFRFQKQIGKSFVLFTEVSPFLTKKSVYDLAIIDYTANKYINFGIETENIHRVGPDYLGIGPRIGYKIPTKNKLKSTITLTYQFRYNQNPLIRLYTVFSLNLR